MGSSNLRRFPSDKDSIGKPLDAYQWAFLALWVTTSLWIVAISITMLLFTDRYIFTVTNTARAWYTSSGTAAWADAEAARLLGAGYQVRYVLREAVDLGLLQGASDYAAIEQVLAPWFLAAPTLSSVELVFSDKPAVLMVKPQVADGDGDRGMNVVMQSNANDCFLLGDEGCIDSVNVTGGFPEWYTAIAADALGSADEIIQVDDTATWASGPELLPGEASVAGQPTAWYPVYRFLFRLALDAKGSRMLIGRATVKVGELSGGTLQDARLGGAGRVLLCDASGAVVASARLEDLTEEDAQGARLRPLSCLASQEGALVVSSQMQSPLDHFAVVVSVSGVGDFTNNQLFLVAVISAALAILPYTVLALSCFAVMTRQWVFLLRPNKP